MPVFQHVPDHPLVLPSFRAEYEARKEAAARAASIKESPTMKRKAAPLRALQAESKERHRVAAEASAMGAEDAAGHRGKVPLGPHTPVEVHSELVIDAPKKKKRSPKK